MEILEDLRECTDKIIRILDSQSESLKYYNKLISELEGEVPNGWFLLEVIRDDMFSIIETRGGIFYEILGNSSYLMSLIWAILWLILISHLGKNEDSMKKYYRALGILPLLFNISRVYLHYGTRVQFEKMEKLVSSLAERCESMMKTLSESIANYKLGNLAIERSGRMVEIYNNYLFENNEVFRGLLPSIQEKPAFCWCFLFLSLTILGFILLVILHILREKNRYIIMFGVTKRIKESLLYYARLEIVIYAVGFLCLFLFLFCG